MVYNTIANNYKACELAPDWVTGQKNKNKQECAELPKNGLQKKISTHLACLMLFSLINLLCSPNFSTPHQNLFTGYKIIIN